jgi:hypothetical protein
VHRTVSDPERALEAIEIAESMLERLTVVLAAAFGVAGFQPSETLNQD